MSSPSSPTQDSTSPRTPLSWLRPALWGVWCVLLGWLVYGVVRRMTRSGLTDDRLYRDFYEFYSGSHAMLTGGDVYAAGELGYIYPPLLAFLLMPLTGLPIAVAGVVWLAIKLVLLVLCLIIGAREVIRRLGIPMQSTTVVVVALFGLLLIIDKVRTEMNMQQSNLLVLLAFTLGLVWLDRRPILSGIALGFGANIKYLTLIALPYLLIRGRFKAAGSLVVSTCVWAVLPATVLGWERNRQLLGQALGGLANLTGSSEQASDAARIIPADFGVSVVSFAVRHIGHGGHTIATIAFLMAVVLGTLGVAWWTYRGSGFSLWSGRWGRPERADARSCAVLLEWCGLIVAALVFSPQTNSPHLSMMILPCMAAVGVLISPARTVSGLPLAIGLALMIAGQVLPPGGIASKASVDAWRSWSVQTWVLLPMFLALLWTGLRSCNRQPPLSH